MYIPYVPAIEVASCYYSIKTSSESHCGVHIVDITPNSVAHNAGLKVCEYNTYIQIYNCALHINERCKLRR